MSFSNDIEDPNDWVKSNGPLKRSVRTAHAKPLDEGDEGAREPTGANADVSVECDDVEPALNPKWHGGGVPTSAEPFVREQLVSFDLVNERDGADEGAEREKVVHRITDEGEAGGEDG